MRALTALAFFVSLAGVANAQTGAGTISGTLHDQSGLVLPGATVTAENPTLAVTRSVPSNERGMFVFAQLPPGTYSVTAELSGFKKAIRSGVILPTASQVSVGIMVLDVGNLSETVAVVADAGLLQVQTRSGERSDLVTNKQLRDIALNGRNVVDLMKTIPGVIAGGTQTTSTVTNVVGSFTVNGTRNEQHEYTIDGVTNLNLGNNTGGLVSVNPDALQEVKVLTSNYQAEYGRAGGGVVALTTRGGTNELQGGLRYFRRHESMNANTFFNNARGGASSGFPKPLYRFNYSGWDLGGPVPVLGTSGDRRMFFFAAQEYYDQLVPQQASMNIRVPTLLERNGDFSQSVDGAGQPVVVRDPLTGQPFPGNVIPSNRFYGVGQKILNFMPAPNAPQGGNAYNYSSQVPSQYPRREDIVRVDWQLAVNSRLSGRFVHNRDEQRFAYGTTLASWNWPVTETIRANGPGNTLSFTLTSNLSSTMTNEFTYGAGRGGVSIAPADDKVSRAVTGISTPLIFASANPGDYIPALGFAGIASVPTVANVNIGGTAFSQHFTIDTFTDSLIKTTGNHTLKAGFYYQRASNASNSQSPVESNISFANDANNPLNTGYPFANALLGVYTQYFQASQKVNQDYFYQDISAYVQDTWKAAKGLTLDLGVRLSYYEPFHNNAGPESFFNPDLFDRSKAARLYRPACVGAATCTATQATYRAVDPAFTGTPTLANTLPALYVGKLVPGAGDPTNGLGQTVNGYPAGGIESSPIMPQPRLGFSWDPNGSGNSVVRGGFGVTIDRYRSLVSGGATNPPAITQPTLVNGFLQDISSGTTGALSPSNVFGIDSNAKWPIIYSYSVGLQRNLGKGILVDVAYVGTQSRNNPQRQNLNALPYGTTFQRSAQNPTVYANGVIPDVESNLPQAHRDAGLSFSGATALPVDFLRPYPGYADILYTTLAGRSSYNSLQAALQRRFAGGLTFGLSYTLSRAETTSSTTDTFIHYQDPQAFDYALADFDRTHYFVANYVWTVPEGGKLLGDGALARALLNNWTISGISLVASGNPAELAYTVAGQDAGNRLVGTYSAGNSAGQQPRFRVTGDAQGAANEIDLAAFGFPGINDPGPYSRMYLRNPGFNTHDLSVFKNFLIGSGGRRTLQFRLEMFNFLNITQFSGVNRTVNVTTATGATGAAIFNDYKNLQLTNNTRPAGSTAPPGQFFGEYNAARDPRIIQLGVKLYF
ncbi:MAG: Plug and carboxypeptidase regulatory-like domain-containing protein [Vicinamibacterales bacterium]|nr:Plug and carboxypeptidase regulatory-like domain-containing protein [Vicinamibacterales bacterium]